MLQFLSTSMSVKAQAAILSIHDVNLVPNILIFMGLVVFILGLAYTLLALYTVREDKKYKRPGVVPITIYTFFYLMAYPIILVVSVYKLIMGKRKW